MRERVQELHPIYQRKITKIKTYRRWPRRTPPLRRSGVMRSPRLVLRTPVTWRQLCAVTKSQWLQSSEEATDLVESIKQAIVQLGFQSPTGAQVGRALEAVERTTPSLRRRLRLVPSSRPTATWLPPPGPSPGPRVGTAGFVPLAALTTRHRLPGGRAWR